MAYDSRFPHMHPLDGRGIPGLDVVERQRAEKVARVIASRTQTVPFFNTITGGIFFARGQTPNMGPYELPWIGSKRPEPHEIDDIVSYMNLSLVPNSVKERWAEGHAKREAHEKTEWQRNITEDRRHDIEDYAAHLSRKRRGTQTLVKVL